MYLAQQQLATQRSAAVAALSLKQDHEKKAEEKKLEQQKEADGKALEQKKAAAEQTHALEAKKVDLKKKRQEAEAAKAAIDSVYTIYFRLLGLLFYSIGMILYSQWKAWRE